MKTKSFLLFSTSVFATSIFLIVVHSQQPHSIQNIVTKTHRHIKDFQDNLRDVEENHLVQEEHYLDALGLGAHPPERWHNISMPVLVTYARGDSHAQAVGFLRAAAAKLPYTVLLYNLGLTPNALSIVSNYCNSSKCIIMEFDLSIYPSHVRDESIYAFRPLIIQHALSVAGGVIFAERWRRWAGSAAELSAAWAEAARAGVVAWARRAAVTSLTHPRMFSYLRARRDDFLFVPAVDVSRLMLSAGAAPLLRAWVRCALTEDCIMPLGAQLAGCRFDKKPQYRYSGCHAQDASALSILLGLRFGLDEARYTYSGRRRLWRAESDEDARRQYRALLHNSTDLYQISIVL